MRPSVNGSNGRNSAGRFAKGNQGGPGNPLGHRVAALRKALLEAVSEEDLWAIITKLVEQAKAGDIQAAKEILLRTLGKPVETDLVERLDKLEEQLLQRAKFDR